MNPSLFDALAAIGYPTGKIPTHPAFGKFYRAGAYWLKMITDGVAVFGNWATSEKVTWFADDLPTDPKAIAERKKLINLETQRIKRLQAKEWQEAAIRARSIWFDMCIAADNYHPYLQKKRLKPYGLKQYRDALIVPVYSCIDGKIMSVQFIEANGSKRFLTGGNSKGYFAARRYKTGERIIIAEGWATSQSLAQHWHVEGWHICAFNAGNLLAVAKALRKSYPFAQIVIAADNDVSGAGQVAAQLAAKAVGASVSMPQFTDDERAKYGKISDWQDRWMIDQRNIKEVTRYAD
jgi:putative DNA primase/helicase